MCIGVHRNQVDWSTHVLRLVGMKWSPCLKGILYSGKLLREKLSQISSFVGIVFSTKFWGVASFGVAKASNPQKFSPSKVSHIY